MDVLVTESTNGAALAAARGGHHVEGRAHGHTEVVNESHGRDSGMAPARESW